MKKNKFLFSLCGVTFLRLRKKGTERKMFTFFFSQQKKTSHLKQGNKGKQVNK